MPFRNNESRLKGDLKMKKLMLVFGLVFLLSSGLVFAQELPEEPVVDPNPVTEVRTKTETSLVVERTPEKPITVTKIYNIAELQAEIAKYQAVIDIWQAKIDPLQAIIDEYNSMK
jgi:hypothetical protein